MQTITEIPEPSIPLCRSFPPPSYADPINWSGTEYMAAFLDFTGSGTPQVVAGFSPAPSGDVLKPYQVALAVPTGPNSRPLFGTELPQFEGTVFSNNTFGSPNLEFSIKDFSQLYQAITGQTLTSSSTDYLGADAGSSQGRTDERGLLFRAARERRRGDHTWHLPARIAADPGQSPRTPVFHGPSRSGPGLTS